MPKMSSETAVKEMTDGNPLRLIVRFSVPLIISSVLQLLFVVADSAIVGRMLGVTAFAAIGATVSPHWLLLSAVIGFNQGFSTLIAQRFGAKDTEGLKGAFVTAGYLAVLFSLVIGVTGVLICRPLLTLMNTPTDLMDGSVTYLLWFWAGMPIVFCYNYSALVLFALGDSKTPLRAMIVATVVNIAFDLILIIPFEIAGVAAASLIAQASALVYCVFAIKKTGVFKGCGLKYDIKCVWPLMRLALPLGFRNSVIEIGGLIVQRYVNSYGTEFVAGIAAAKRMYSLLMIAGGAVEVSIATFIAQNFGAKKFDRIKQGLKEGLKLALGTVAVIMLITLPLSRQILGLLVDGEPERLALVLDTGARQLTIMTIGLPFLYLLFLYRSALQGLGNTFIPMISGFIELGFRIVSVMVLTHFIGSWGVMLSDPLAWPFATALLGISYVVVFRRARNKFNSEKEKDSSLCSE